MIQRIQTLWLLLASICAFLTLKFPFYIISEPNNTVSEFNATSETPLLMLTSILGALCFIIIFMFRHRSLQMRLSIVSLLISILNMVLDFRYINNYTAGGVSIFSVFTFLVPVFLLLAIRGIYKDQQLLKKADRIR
jgi:O-antigen/teichoic acid export membrane protein